MMDIYLFIAPIKVHDLLGGKVRSSAGRCMKVHDLQY